MAFWGIEVKPGNPYTHFSKTSKGRLHISQATLGIGSGTNKSLVQCNVGDKYPVFLCALLPGKTESCSLDLEFQEVDDVLFSVIGPRSVHLTGYYLPSRPQLGGDDESESYGEDIVNSENDESIRCSEDDDYEDSFIDDDDDDVKDRPPSAASIDSDDDEVTGVSKPIKGKNRKRLKKQYEADEPVVVDVPEQKKRVSRRNRASVVESDDDDDLLPLSSLGKAEINETNIKLQEQGEHKGDIFESSNGKETIVSPENRSLPRDQQSTKGGDLKRSSPDVTVSNEGPKTKKRKKDHEVKVNEISALKKQEDLDTEANTHKEIRSETENGITQPEVTNKKNKKKKKKMQQDNSGANMPPLVGDNGNSIPAEIKGSTFDHSASRIRTLSSGLIIEELEDGKVDGKLACRGKKVKIKYVGNLKNGPVFESNFDESPFKFRLGAGKVIQGWDIGIEGMRVGGKRRLTIPPALGYGSQGNGENIPPDSWLVYDIELVSAR
ncbi:unnamed protein product [Rhodiola kirilowii]